MRFIAAATGAGAPAPAPAEPAPSPAADDVLHIGCCDALLAAATDGPMYALCGVDCREQQIHLALPDGAEVCPLCAERAEAAAAQAEAAGVSACDLVCPNMTFRDWGGEP
ncbi:hypothetical protein CLV92_1047 [Kineococcus xinjiangensis]|uniref:Uncharacterized protein n=1 Tax=Kineococcus xinjiangensis TaxID=512762 RepID=A0A2S6ISE5_9ACTN|nr:hypothetical protein [Kineococcus xinjiangensis]PPK97192.1 hypothetical protein CLV92_1047 [Kineococcus xinjiangensis]